MAWQSVVIAGFSDMLIVEDQGSKSKNMDLKILGFEPGACI
jgi:hypothetical protein